MLGASGTNWEQGGVRGVEILGIAPDSAAEVSGLHTGDVITDVNGRKIRSTQDLAGVLVQNGPGRRISVGLYVQEQLGLDAEGNGGRPHQVIERYPFGESGSRYANCSIETVAKKPDTTDTRLYPDRADRGHYHPAHPHRNGDTDGACDD